MACAQLPCCVVGITPQRASAVSDQARRNPAVAYLTPFFVVLIAGLISQGISAGFEWLYPLALVAAAMALWCFRSNYSELDWNAGPLSIAMGGLVFAVWIGIDHFDGGHPGSAIVSGLAGSPGWIRIAWLAVRTAAAVITVPIAQELAFRGFLIRRLLSPHFESLSPREYTVAAALISSLLFGMLHGERWLAGTLAGLLYTTAFLGRGRIGDAIVAHATANSLLAAWVMSNAKWYLW